MPRRDASAVWCAVAWQWRWPIDNTLDGGRRCASSCSTATRNGFGSAITPTARSRVRVLCVCASCACAPVQQPPQCAPVQGHVLPCARGLLVFLSALVWPLSLACCLPACLAARSPVSRINTLAWWLVCATCSSTGARGKSQGRGGAGQPGAGDAWQPLWQLVGRLECWASLCANAVHCVARIQCNVLRVAGVECVACCRCLSSPCVCPRHRDGVGRELERLLPASADLLERLVPASADLSASVAWSSVSRSWTWTR